MYNFSDNLVNTALPKEHGKVMTVAKNNRVADRRNRVITCLD